MGSFPPRKLLLCELLLLLLLSLPLQFLVVVVVPGTDRLLLAVTGCSVTGSELVEDLVEAPEPPPPRHEQQAEEQTVEEPFCRWFLPLASPAEAATFFDSFRSRRMTLSIRSTRLSLLLPSFDRCCFEVEDDEEDFREAEEEDLHFFAFSGWWWWLWLWL